MSARGRRRTVGKRMGRVCECLGMLGLLTAWPEWFWLRGIEGGGLGASGWKKNREGGGSAVGEKEEGLP